MPDDRPSGAAIPYATWLATVHEIIGDAGGPELTADERDALLHIARISAHTSERITAPLTTFLAGVAYGSLPAKERLAAIQALASRLKP
jgi:hypothetical protein